MSKLKRKTRHKQKISLISMAPVAFIGAAAYQGYKEGGFGRALDLPLMNVTGMHFYQLGGGEGTSWNPARMVPFVGVLAGTYVAKKLIAVSGVNKALGKLPFRL